MTPEQEARVNIDRLLEQAGWSVQNADSINLYASSGVAVREFPLKSGHGTADYLLYVNQKAAGVVEAKPEGSTLTGVEVQSEKYSTGLPDNLPAHQRPLPFLYESTGAETQFTNRLDPEPRSRLVFSFHTPETLAKWIGVSETPDADTRRIAEDGRDYLAGSQPAPETEVYAVPKRVWPLAGAAKGHQEPGGVSGSGAAAGAGADGNRKRQDLHGLQPGIPLDQARRSAASAVPRGP